MIKRRSSLHINIPVKRLSNAIELLSDTGVGKPTSGQQNAYSAFSHDTPQVWLETFPAVTKTVRRMKLILTFRSELTCPKTQKNY